MSCWERQCYWVRHRGGGDAFGFTSAAFADAKAAALFLPPQGEIDHTVLLLCAQLLLFAATLLGVDGYYDKMRDLIKK